MRRLSGVVSMAAVVVAACSGADGQDRKLSPRGDSLYRAIKDSMYRAGFRWQYSADTNAMDGSVSHFLRVEASPTARSHEPTLMVRCVGGQTEAYVALDDENVSDDLYADGEASVRLRMDSAAATRTMWHTADDHTALFAPAPVPLLRRLAHASTFRFEYTPSDEAPRVATFDVAGLDSLLPRIARPCHWKA